MIAYIGVYRSSLLRLPRTAANLWDQEIDAEGCVLVYEIALEFCDLLAEHVWRVPNTTDHTDATGICDGSGELRSRSDVHARQHDRMVDLEEIRRRRAELFCGICVSVQVTALSRWTVHRAYGAKSWPWLRY